MPTLADLQALPAEQRELLMDVGQFTLDIIGIFDPTPVADLTNAVVSLMRRDLFGASVSVIAAVPFVGDLAKLGKLPRYLKIVERAIEVARTDSRFAEMLRPILNKLLWALDRLPIEKMPPGLLRPLDQMRETIARFLGASRAMSRADAYTEKILQLLLGSTRNVGLLPRRNVRTIVEFLERQKVPQGVNMNTWLDVISGIDLHAVEPVTIETFRAGEMFAQYVSKGEPGRWLVRVRGGVSHRNLGVSAGGPYLDKMGEVRDATRKLEIFKLRSNMEVLKSKAATKADTWTYGRTSSANVVVWENGKQVIKPAEFVGGGGEQYYIPNKMLLEPVGDKITASGQR